MGQGDCNWWSWPKGASLDDAIICNIGDMLMRLSANFEKEKNQQAPWLVKKDGD